MTAHDDREHLCEIDQTAEPCNVAGQPAPVTESPLFRDAPSLTFSLDRPISADDLRRCCAHGRVFT